jgi:hypothetical protein
MSNEKSSNKLIIEKLSAQFDCIEKVAKKENCD